MKSLLEQGIDDLKQGRVIPYINRRHRMRAYVVVGFDTECHHFPDGMRILSIHGTQSSALEAKSQIEKEHFCIELGKCMTFSVLNFPLRGIK